MITLKKIKEVVEGISGHEIPKLKRHNLVLKQVYYILSEELTYNHKEDIAKEIGLKYRQIYEYKKDELMSNLEFRNLYLKCKRRLEDKDDDINFRLHKLEQEVEMLKLMLNNISKKV